jgi:putative transposase
LSLVAEGESDALLADRACDADRLIDAILDAGAEPVIPPRASARLRQGPPQRAQGHRRLFNNLKQFRRIATRYDKLLNNFMAFVKIPAIATWLG